MEGYPVLVARGAEGAGLGSADAKRARRLERLIRLERLVRTVGGDAQAVGICQPAERGEVVRLDVARAIGCGGVGNERGAVTAGAVVVEAQLRRAIAVVQIQPRIDSAAQVQRLDRVLVAAGGV